MASGSRTTSSKKAGTKGKSKAKKRNPKRDTSRWTKEKMGTPF